MMPANTGTRPPFERVDIRLEGGGIGRNRDPSKYDWKLGSECKGVPIASWQRSKG
jgi:hypothetical protein